MKYRGLKYTLALIIPASVAVAFTQYGWQTFLPLLIAFGLIPGIELFIRADASNLDATQKEIVKRDKLYDYLLYLMVPLQYAYLAWFAFSVNDLAFSQIEFWGRAISMGLMCGVIGINIGHELGHRQAKSGQWMAKLLLASSLYTHFFIEHNFGHHKNVATKDDPASARYNETVFGFWFRSIWNSYWHAWKIQRQLLMSRKKPFWSVENHMLGFQLLHLLLILAFTIVGWKAVVGFLVAAIFGMVLLETVNYIEHYGLERKKVNEKRYENASPAHSWNSNHVVGRLMLYELSRHSDHHAYPHKPYQLLAHHDESPQLPTGYPGMMLLSLLPPIFFRVMNPRISN